MVEATCADKPKHPLSSYNIFFQVERKRILAGVDHLRRPILLEEVQTVLLENRSKPKRKHRKSHGLFSFHELSRRVADKWKTIDKESRRVIDHQAKVEKQNYYVAIEKWRTLNAVTTETAGEQPPHSAEPDSVLAPANQPKARVLRSHRNRAAKKNLITAVSPEEEDDEGLPELEESAMPTLPPDNSRTSEDTAVVSFTSCAFEQNEQNVERVDGGAGGGFSGDVVSEKTGEVHHESVLQDLAMTDLCSSLAFEDVGASDMELLGALIDPLELDHIFD